MASLFTSELKEGMITLTDTYSTQGKLILGKDTVITKNIINKLVNNDVIFIEVSEDTTANHNPDSNNNMDVSSLEADLIPSLSITSKPEYKKFKRRYEKNVEIIGNHLNDIVHKNAPLDIDTMLTNTVNILKATDSPLSIFTMLSTLKNYDDSTFHHSLNVALISNIFGRWLELSDSDIELLTLCGLFHDVGKLLIPESIIKKPDKLTDKEFAIVKQHPKLGYDLLKSRNADLNIQYAALMHHEKCDGSGYPLGLIDKQINWYAQIITIADIYEAMTANRVYRGPLSPFKVINMFENDGLKKYNPKFLLTFLEHVVNSYMNCKVRLSNGEEGDIVYINKVRLSKPMIKTKDTYIDLSKNADINIESIM
ncbi:MAG: HD-GYP domain-containing protein [Eubacteriales bacterium]|nr:HD-GYP domain-containing protein [Eubacteriales bacterium]